jgi:hypothetical protein
MSTPLPPGPIDPRAIGNEPAFPYSQVTESYHHAYDHHRGTTKAEAVFIRVLAGYVAAGFDRPTVDLIAKAEETTAAALESMARLRGALL